MWTRTPRFPLLNPITKFTSLKLNCPYSSTWGKKKKAPSNYLQLHFYKYFSQQSRWMTVSDPSSPWGEGGGCASLANLKRQPRRAPRWGRGARASLTQSSCRGPTAHRPRVGSIAHSMCTCVSMCAWVCKYNQRWIGRGYWELTDRPSTVMTFSQRV